MDPGEIPQLGRAPQGFLVFRLENRGRKNG